MFSLACKYCKCSFEHRYSQTQYCTKRCAYDARIKPAKLCGHCGVELTGSKRQQKFCSVLCGALNRAPAMRQPRLNEAREKPCEHCGELFGLSQQHDNLAKFRARRFCSTKCAAAVNLKSGEAHPRWKPGLKQRSTRGGQIQWRLAVKKRDAWTCQGCGQQGGTLHAHHVHEFAKYPDKRWDTSNGITLCFACHRDIHATIRRVVNMQGVNSVKPYGPIRPVDNTEPSRGGNPPEGVTTRGRAYGTWQGACVECGAFFQRAWTKVRAKLPNVYCGCSCAARARNRVRYAGVRQ